MTTDHKRGVAVLAERAERNGWDVSKSGGGHTKFTRPDGQSMVIGATPSDIRSYENDRHALRRFGLPDGWEDPRREERVRRAGSSGVSNATAVLALLQRDGTPLSITEIVSATGIGSQQVSVALQWLLKRHPEIERPARGTYVWKPGPCPKVEPYADRHARNGNGNGDVPPIDVHVPVVRRAINVIPAALPEDLPSMFEAVTTDRDNNIVLRDENGDLWVATPLKPVPRGQGHDITLP